MRRILLVLALAVLLSSCIGIDSKVKFNKDGSGVIVLTYRVSRQLVDLGGLQDDVPLPLSEEDFRFALEGKPGLKLLRVKEKKDDRDVVIGAEISFDRIESFTELDSFRDMPMSLAKDGSEYVFEQKLLAAQEDKESVDDEAELLSPMLDGYELSFTVTAPTPVTYYNLGELSRDKRSVIYTIQLAELISRIEEIILIVRWKG